MQASSQPESIFCRGNTVTKTWIPHNKSAPATAAATAAAAAAAARTITDSIADPELKLYPESSDFDTNTGDPSTGGGTSAAKTTNTCARKCDCGTDWNAYADVSRRQCWSGDDVDKQHLKRCDGKANAGIGKTGSTGDHSAENFPPAGGGCVGQHKCTPVRYERSEPMAPRGAGGSDWLWKAFGWAAKASTPAAAGAAAADISGEGKGAWSKAGAANVHYNRTDARTNIQLAATLPEIVAGDTSDALAAESASSCCCCCGSIFDETEPSCVASDDGAENTFGQQTADSIRTEVAIPEIESSKGNEESATGSTEVNSDTNGASAGNMHNDIEITSWQCVTKQSAIFSTEGHVFLLDPSLRYIAPPDFSEDGQARSKTSAKAKPSKPPLLCSVAQ